MVYEKNDDETKKTGDDDSRDEDTEIKFDFLDENNSNEDSSEKSEEQYDKDELLPILLQQEEIENLKRQLEEVTREKDDLYDRLLRKLADFNNYRKRVEREKEETIKFASAKIIKDLLPIIDNFEKALSSSNNRDNNFYKGIELIYKQLIDILIRNGVQGIKAEGEQFDPAYHEAIGTEEIEDKENNIILEEYQKGYLLHNKLLRPSLVKVNVRKNCLSDSEKNSKEVGDNEKSNWN